MAYSSVEFLNGRYNEAKSEVGYIGRLQDYLDLAATLKCVLQFGYLALEQSEQTVRRDVTEPPLLGVNAQLVSLRLRQPRQRLVIVLEVPKRAHTAGPLKLSSGIPRTVGEIWSDLGPHDH